MPTIQMIIKGKVQGVFYRATAKKITIKLGITGWIKNTNSGHVEAMAKGERSHINEFILWCKKGPKNAWVTEVSINEIMDQRFPDFTIIKDQ